MAKKAKAKKAAAPKKEPVDDITDGVNNMAVSAPPSFELWSMDFACPYMIKQFLFNGRQGCSVDLLVPTVHEDKVRPKVVKGTHLAVNFVVPDFFPEEERMLVANQGNAAFNQNTSLATAHSEVVQDVRKIYNSEAEILGNPQMIKLPFKVEDDIAAWACDLYHGDALVSAAAAAPAVLFHSPR